MSTDVIVPQIGESVTSVFIARWILAPGQAVRAGEPVVEVDSDKASMEIPAPVSGVLLRQLAAEGDEVEVGSVLGHIDENGEAPAKEVASEAPKEDQAGGQTGPAARQAASERGVDLDAVKGTGRRGRVTRADVERAEPTPAAGAATPTPIPPDMGARVERVRMSPLRRTIARRLVEAQQTAAMLTTFNEVDMSRVMALRKRFQEDFKGKYGIKLGFMSFFVKAAIESLKAFPAANAEVGDNEFLYKRYYNIGVAVSSSKGLVVPVIRDADRLSFAGVEEAITDVAVRARDNKLRLEDFSDGTFTITNGGIFGSMMSTPILNLPQVAILGMHNIVQRPVGVNGNIELRPMMYLALSYDHRIIDGREAVGFLIRVKQCIEDPERILLEV